MRIIYAFDRNFTPCLLLLRFPASMYLSPCRHRTQALCGGSTDLVSSTCLHFFTLCSHRQTLRSMFSFIVHRQIFKNVLFVIRKKSYTLFVQMLCLLLFSTACSSYIEKSKNYFRKYSKINHWPKVAHVATYKSKS